MGLNNTATGNMLQKSFITLLIAALVGAQDQQQFINQLRQQGFTDAQIGQFLQQQQQPQQGGFQQQPAGFQQQQGGFQQPQGGFQQQQPGGFQQQPAQAQGFPQQVRQPVPQQAPQQPPQQQTQQQLPPRSKVFFDVQINNQDAGRI